MIDLKAIAAGVAVTGALAFGSLGAGVANAAPADPAVPSVQGTSSQTDDHEIVPSPYAAYGGSGMCATPGLYFVNICV
ncbi:hypothetical protein CIW49_13240 [Mycolicibacterium sp. P1-18]|uniref:hypothetical protein n=1 Tax=Mycolicibacterium sp. P1-18 TaxID=2024615 RepID=UPI0011F28B0E|nr:hypothetical protein [Mycolicibacterium sp. P1-18]KAA0098842.1 hypothetical protein CIW49_13240 [Mycolicibacterium sp. P1-18]